MTGNVGSQIGCRSQPVTPLFPFPVYMDHNLMHPVVNLLFGTMHTMVGDSRFGVRNGYDTVPYITSSPTFSTPNSTKKEIANFAISFFSELLTRLELVTSSLPRKCSTTELQQQLCSLKAVAKVRKKIESAKYSGRFFLKNFVSPRFYALFKDVTDGVCAPIPVSNGGDGGIKPVRPPSKNAISAPPRCPFRPCRRPPSRTRGTPCGRSGRTACR